MSSTDGTDIRVKRHAHVAVVEVNRPPLNFFDLELIRNLLGACQELEADPECRAIVLAASGKVFCAGADFGAGVDPKMAIEAARILYSDAAGLFDLNIPIVAAIQGPAIGGGLGLALVADFRIAGDKAVFSANFAQLGLHCGFGISVSLPRVIGQNPAAELLMTGRRISAADAHAIGLADRLVAQNDLRNEALALASEIAAAAPLAVCDMRRTLRKGLADSVRSALEHELAIQARHMRTQDFKEGIRAASERRTPVFTGT
jgi:enoyl-CoA hydratase/carnithine racemase